MSLLPPNKCGASLTANASSGMTFFEVSLRVIISGGIHGMKRKVQEKANTNYMRDHACLPGSFKDKVLGFDLLSQLLCL